MQNPHCTAPSSTKACCTSLERAVGGEALDRGDLADRRPTPRARGTSTTSSPSTRPSTTRTRPARTRPSRPGRPSRSRSTYSRLSPSPRVADVVVSSPLTREPVVLAHAAATRRSARAAMHLDGVPAVGGGRPVVVDRPDLGRRRAGRTRSGSALDAAVGLGPLLRVTRADDRRPDRARRRPLSGSVIDDEREARDRDHHRVAHADLQELLRALRQRHHCRHDELAGLAARCASARPGTRGSTGHASRPDRPHHDRGVERRQHGQAVAGRRPGAEVAADASPALRICGEPTVRAACARAGSVAGERRLHQLRAGHAGARAGSSRPRRRHRRSSVDPAERDDVVRAGDGRS